MRKLAPALVPITVIIVCLIFWCLRPTEMSRLSVLFDGVTAALLVLTVYWQVKAFHEQKVVTAIAKQANDQTREQIQKEEESHRQSLWLQVEVARLEILNQEIRDIDLRLEAIRHRNFKRIPPGPSSERTRLDAREKELTVEKQAKRKEKEELTQKLRDLAGQLQMR